MTFHEYDELHERCEMYKARALSAILVLTGNALEVGKIITWSSYLNRCSDTEFAYHIRLADGCNLEGTMSIEIIDLYLSGNVAEAKTKYKEL